MPCKRLQHSYHPSTNSLTLVPTGTTEYIAAGDSQAAVPFPTEIGRDFDLQWKTASGLSYLLLQLVVTAGKQAFQRRALRRPHPARREVTCGDTDMDWPRLGAVPRTIERSQEGTRGGLEGFILLAPFRNLTMRSCFPRDRPSTASWWAAIAPTYTFKVEGDSLRSNLSRRKALLQSCIFGGLLGEKNTSSRTDSISVRRFALLKER